jgi:hypothetical protein
MLQTFENGITSTGDDEQSGWNSTSRSKPLIAQVKNIIHGNCQLTVSEEVGIYQFSAKSEQSPLTDYLLQRANDNDNLWKMSLPVTGYGFIVMTLKPNNSPDTGWILHASEDNASCIFSHRGNVGHEFSPEGQTVNQDFYLAVLRCLWDVIWRKWPEMWTVGCWFLHLCNGPAHTAPSIRQFLPSHNPHIHLTSPIPTSSYSLNSKLPLKEEDFRQQKTVSLMSWMTCRQDHKHPLNSASKIEKGPNTPSTF